MSHYRYPHQALASTEDLRASADAYAWHAAASNGFGDAGLGSLPRLDAMTPALSAAPAPAPLLGLLVDAVHALVVRFKVARRGWWAWQRRRATDDALRALDDRGLRDLGLDRSEISSVAAGMSRYGDPTRVRMSQALQGFVV